MDVSSIGSLSTAPRATAETSSETETTSSASNGTQGQVSQETQTSSVPPVQAPSDTGGEEGSVVTQDNSGSANAQSSSTESDTGGQVDVLA
ncbi:MAG: hypothetical protein H8E32_09910 [Nitrospinae bacterium]|nr:hypothetical protein [Nitrospinota bacterium]